ncbi:MAG TPA: hypothetical protein PKC72_12950 [Chitinophagaceae bacterium]|nr:hypothetical protein [Chitinophagaceae bacterium]
MIKQILAFLLLVAFATQTFDRAFFIFDYLLETKSYAKNCENKAKPQLHCNGKCQLMKKLKAEENRDKSNPERKAENRNEITLSSRSFFTTELIPSTDIFCATVLFIREEKDIVDISYSIFHPPRS